MFLIAICCGLYADISTGLEFQPALLVPAGIRGENYMTGMGGDLSALISVPGISFLTPMVQMSVSLVPLDLEESGVVSSTNLNLVRLGMGSRVSMVSLDRFSLYLDANACGYLASLSGESSGSASGLALGFGGGMGFQLSPSFSLAVHGGYETYLDLYDCIGISVGGTYRLPGPGNATIPRADYVPSESGLLIGSVEFVSADIQRVFPVLYKYYDDHPLGRAVIVNRGSRIIENVEVRLSLQRFIDAPKLSARMDNLKPGEEAEVDLYALFTDDILSITEGAKVAARVIVNYTAAGRKGQDTSVVTLNTYNRNALRWDDDRKIAAFITARDEEVLRFSRNTASIVDDMGNPALPRELQLAVLFICAMDTHKLTYVVDPSSSYFELSRKDDVIDTVQFPRQTLQFRAGDCDDLAAAYAALLESAGISTGFITVPGHIYAAFRLEMSRDEAIRMFSRADDLILPEDGSVWIPMETTLLREGFLPSWSEGAAQWRKHSRVGRAELIVTSEAWRTYEPVAFSVSDGEVDIPLRNAVLAGFSDEIDLLVQREIAGREVQLKERIRRRPDDCAGINQLGVLYARFGLYSRAETEFRRAAEQGSYRPALINLGNISLLKDQLREAEQAFSTVLKADADNPAALLGMSQASYAAKNFPEAEKAFARLEASAPLIAERYSYLSGTTGADESAGRASDNASRGQNIMWEE